MIQWYIHVNTQKVNANGDLETSKVGIRTKFLHQVSKDELITEYKKQANKILDANEVMNSGYLITGISHILICIAKDGRHIKGYGNKESHVSYPEKCPGRKGIILIDCHQDCVELTMVALLEKRYENITSNRVQRAAHYQRIRMKYFNFPRFPDGLVKINDLNKIETKTNTNIMLYSLKRDGDGYNITLIRKGNNPSVIKSRYLHLCTLLDSNHVFGIPNIHTFLATIRYKNNSSRYLKNKTVCSYCMGAIPSEKLENHEELCKTFTSSACIKNLPKHKMYKFTRLNATELSPFVVVYDTETFKNEKNEHSLLAYSFIIIDKHNRVVCQELKTIGKSQTSNEFANEFITDIDDCIAKVYEEYQALLNCNPVLTHEDDISHASKTSCEVCNIPSGVDIVKNRHHRWDQKLEYNEAGLLVKGNYVGALCTQCNMLISAKYCELPVIAHNSGRFDSKFIIDGFREEHFKSIELLHKTGENFLNIKIKSNKGKFSLCYIDSFNFLSSSLETLINDLNVSQHTFSIFDNYFENVKSYPSSVITKLKRKNVFPYEYITSVKQAYDTKELPSMKGFYSTLKESDVTPENYSFACEMFKETGCNSLMDYLKLYLECDVLLLAEVVLAFRKEMVNRSGLDPLCFLSAPGFSMEAALFESKIKIELIKDVEIYTLFEKNIRGGFSCAIEGYYELNNKYLKHFKSDEANTFAVMLDFNSLYASCLVSDLPTGKIYELTPSEIESFTIDQALTNTNYSFCMLIDYEIPDDVKIKTDEFPLGLHHFTPNENDLSEFTKTLLQNGNMKANSTSKLVASHLPQKNYLISLELLQHHTTLGLIATKIHRIFRFKKEPVFKSFIEKNIEARKQCTSKAKSNYLKLLNNSIFGKCLFNVRKHSEKIALVTNKKQFETYINKHSLKECVPISENALLIKYHSNNIQLAYPLHIGFFILEKAKHFMYNFYYNVLKKKFGSNVKLCYTDTDSLLLRFNDVDVFEQFKVPPLSDYVDTSNFNPSHELYSDHNKGKLGFLKSETGGDLIKEYVCLQAKCYSILLDDDKTKLAAKGVTSHKQHFLTHSLYKDIHTLTKSSFNLNVSKLTKRCNIIKQTSHNRRALSKVDNKRYWVDSVSSLGYGHPKIPVNTATVPSTPPNERVRNPKRKDRSPVSLSLYHKIAKPGFDLYK